MLAHLHVAVGVGHRQPPLAGAGAERLAVPSPLLPRGHGLLADAVVLHADHPVPEADAAEHAEVARLRHHLAVARELLRHALRPREVGVLVHGPRRLELGAGQGARPHAAEHGVGLEDGRLAAELQEVLAHREAADACSDDDHPLLLHACRCRRCDAWLGCAASAREVRSGSWLAVTMNLMSDQVASYRRSVRSSCHVLKKMK